MKSLIAILVFSFLCGYPCGEDKPQSVVSIVGQKSDTSDPTLEITFADVPLTYEERMKYHFLQDSLFRAGNDGLYNGPIHRGFHPDTPFIANGGRDTVLALLKKFSLCYTNSAFAVRGYSFDTADQCISNGYSLWTFTHRAVRNK